MTVMTEDGDAVFCLTARLVLLAEVIAGYFHQRLLPEAALGEAGTAAPWRRGSDGAVTAPLQETSDLATVSDGALAGPGAALRPGYRSQRAVLADLRDAGLGLTVSHRAEPGVRAAVAGRKGGEVSVRTEGGAALLLSAGQTETVLRVLAEPRVRAAVAGGQRGHRAVPAVINPAVDSRAVPGTEQGAGTTPPGRGGGHRAIRTELHQAACSNTLSQTQAELSTGDTNLWQSSYWQQPQEPQLGEELPPGPHQREAPGGNRAGGHHREPELRQDRIRRGTDCCRHTPGSSQSREQLGGEGEISP